MALKTSKGSELLSYIINQDPILSENIDLPVQGESIKPIGKIIVDNGRYKNAFINALNLIAVTLITQNDWENPWEEFTEQGKIDFGQSVREMIVDLVEAHDYNEYRNNATHFLQHEIPDVYNYIYDINFQKFYKVTVNDTEIAMAFTSEKGLYDLIQSIYSRLYESYKYDKYIVDKYQLCRRIIDGTVTSVQIENFDENTTRENVAIIKGYSNKLTFRSPNYNPAGLRLATPFSRQRTIINNEFEGRLTTEVLATSYFRNDAEMKTKLALIDGFNDFDSTRLANLLGDAYVEFTEDELTKLGNVIAMIIDDDFFRDFYYAMDTKAEETGATKTTEFYNPETLDNTLWLHVWRIFATSPFVNAIVFSRTESSVTSVSIDPATANVSAGQSVQFKAIVETTGITNQSVQWTVDSQSAQDGVEINANGELKVPANVSVQSITVTATSIYDDTKSATASVTVGQGGGASILPEYDITYDDNGDYEIIPSEGYDAIAKTTVHVNVQGGASIQPVKSVSFDSNDTYSVTPDNGYDALGEVSVTVDVPAPAIYNDSVSTSITLNNATGNYYSTDVYAPAGYDAMTQATFTVEAEFPLSVFLHNNSSNSSIDLSSYQVNYGNSYNAEILNLTANEYVSAIEYLDNDISATAFDSATNTISVDSVGGNIFVQIDDV